MEASRDGRLKPASTKPRSLLTWEKVRGMGELQILTRASYAMLVIVPLLVGLWPSVRLIINNHNRLLEQSTQELAQAGDKLSAQVAALAATLERATTPLAEGGS
ncbi:MAG: hypothetical protein ICV73_18475, partial [Acetobacteraceae bacterium]|nr:hypothetical protein [Acetobacteraceae bacterium]